MPFYRLCCHNIEQKWGKGKSREKMNAKVLFDEDGWVRFNNEVPKVTSDIHYFCLLTTGGIPFIIHPVISDESHNAIGPCRASENQRVASTSGMQVPC